MVGPSNNYISALVTVNVEIEADENVHYKRVVFYEQMVG